MGTIRLTEAEEARAQACAAGPVRARFLAGCRLARTAVSEFAGVAIDDLIITRTCSECGGEHGRPRVRTASRSTLTDPLADVDLSISHAGDWVVVAVTADGRVGVDIEEHTSAAAFASDPHLADWVLHPEERPSGPDTSMLPSHLLRTWVRKEAVVKATGDGLRQPFAGIHVRDGNPPRVVACQGRAAAVPRLRLLDAETPTGLVGAVATLDIRSPVS